MCSSVGLKLALASVALLLAYAAPATAATRYASPSGTGLACSQASPCDIQTAVEGPGVIANDEVILLPGDYAVGANSLVPPVAVDMHGVLGQPRPRILSSANSAVDVQIPGVLVRDLGIEHSGGSGGVALSIMAASTAERVIARSSANIACLPALGALIRDSVCHSTASDQAAVRFFYSGTEGPSTATLVNVTALASVGNSHAIELGTFDVGIQTLTATNVIANGSGTAADVSAFNFGTSVTIDLDHSNYDTENQGSGTIITDPGSGTNQLAPPRFLNAGAGDFHQDAGSPTINAGATAPLLGSSDLDGAPRTQGTAPDIGAYEFDQVPPDTQITGAPRKKTKTSKRRKRVRFRFTASEAGSRFECRLDRGGFAPCTAPFSTRVKAGAGKGKGHVFEVRAIDPSGNVDPLPDRHRWRVRRKASG